MLALPARALEALRELETTIAWSRQQNPDSELLRDLTLDLGELRGFEYYTGMRLQAFVKGAGAPVLRGGRYNDLVARYGGDSAATGFAVDVEAVAQAESALGAIDDSLERPGCLLVVGEADRPWAARLASSLRSSGFRVAQEAETTWDCESQDCESHDALLTYAAKANLPAVVRLSSEHVQLLRAGDEAKTLWSKPRRGQASHPTAQSISDALVTMLSGRHS